MISRKFKKKTTLQSTLDEVLDFETRIVEYLSQLNIDNRFIFQVRLAFHEAIINVIVHTYHKKPDKKIDVELVVDDDSITIIIRDYGETVDVAKIKSRDLDDLKESGLGVHFYKTLMDVIEYSKPANDNGNIIKMVKNIA